MNIQEVEVPVNLTAIIEGHGIRKIERYINRYAVTLDNGNLGIGSTVGEALDLAKAVDACNILRLAS